MPRKLGFSMLSSVFCLLVTGYLLLFTFPSIAYAQAVNILGNNSPGPITINDGDTFSLSWSWYGFTPTRCVIYNAMYQVIDPPLPGSKLIGPLSGGTTGVDLLYIMNCRDDLWNLDSNVLKVHVNSANCTNTPINCSSCSAPANTCSTNNGSQTCTLTGPTPCTQVQATQSCTLNNCSSGYICSCFGGGTCGLGSCILPLTVDLKAFNSDGPITVYWGDSIPFSWTIANNPYSCTISLFPSQQGEVSSSGSTTQTTNPFNTGDVTYNASISCPQELAAQVQDWVFVTIKTRPNCTSNPTNCSSCSSPYPNTCSTNNGYQTCTLVGDSTCNPVSAQQQCTVNNCSSGYSCVSGQCLLPNCTTTPSCGSCSATSNTCSTNNGTATCTFTGPSPCTQVSAPPQSCTLNNCSSGYSCIQGTCTLPLTTSCSVSPTLATTGQNVTWSATDASGGLGPGSYTYIWSGDEGLSGNAQQIGKTYSTQGTKTGSVTVTSGSQSITQACSNSVSVQNPNCTTNPTGCDTCGPSNTCGSGSQTCTLTGPSPCNQVVTKQSCTPSCLSGYVCQSSGSCALPVTGSCSVSPTQATTGQSVTWSTSNVSGGTGSYSYSWSGTDGLSGSVSSVSTSYGSQGTKSGSVIVTSGSQSATLTCPTLSVANPSCTTTPTDYSACSTSVFSNTCGPGSQTYTLTGPSPCNYVFNNKQSCSVNCSPGYTCSNGSCILPPTVDLKVYGANEISGLPHNSTADLSWTTTNSPTSCNLYKYTGTGPFGGWDYYSTNSTGLLSSGSITTPPLPGPATGPSVYYYFGMDCKNSAVTPNLISNFDVVPVGILAPPPAVTNATIDASARVVTDAKTTYNITITGTDPQGGGNIGSEYAIINYQGTNAGLHRGYIGWSTQSFPYMTFNTPIACVGGGQAEKNTGYGSEYINLLGCATSVSGSTRTVTFTVSFNSNFTTPADNNTISGWVNNSYNLSDGWKPFGTFSVAPPVLIPTVHITASAVTIDNGTSATLSWTTTNTPTSCTASATPVSSTWTGDPGHQAINSFSTGNLTGPAPYTYTITCSNSAGTSPPDSVTVNVNAPPIPIITQATGLLTDTSQYGRLEPMGDQTILNPNSIYGYVTTPSGTPLSGQVVSLASPVGDYSTITNVDGFYGFTPIIGNGIGVAFTNGYTGALIGGGSPGCTIQGIPSYSGSCPGSSFSISGPGNQTISVTIGSTAYIPDVRFCHYGSICVLSAAPPSSSPPPPYNFVVDIPSPTPSPKPDLIVTDITPENASVVISGTYVIFSGKVKNAARDTVASASRAKLFINYNVDNSLDVSLPFDVGGLAGGLSQVVTWISPNPILAGLHGYAICADSENGVNELYENNNCAMAWFIALPPPSPFQMRPSTTNTQPACLVPGQTPNPSLVDVFWTASDPRFIDGYLLYRYVNGSALAEAPLYLGPSQTSFHDTNVQAGSTYNYAVLAFKNYGTSGMTYTWANNPPFSPPTVDASAGFIQVPATPPSCNPPTITSLEITNLQFSSTSDFTSGANKTSGRQISDQGRNWFNPMEVKLNTQQGSAPIARYEVQFDPGFVLSYHDGAHYLNDTIVDPLGTTIINGIQVFPSSSTQNAISWKVFFRPNFGSRANMRTGAKVIDQNSPAPLSAEVSDCQELNQLGQCKLIITP